MSHLDSQKAVPSQPLYEWMSTAELPLSGRRWARSQIKSDDEYNAILAATRPSATSSSSDQLEGHLEDYEFHVYDMTGYGTEELGNSEELCSETQIQVNLQLERELCLYLGQHSQRISHTTVTSTETSEGRSSEEGFADSDSNSETEATELMQKLTSQNTKTYELPRGPTSDQSTAKPRSVSRKQSHKKEQESTKHRSSPVKIKRRNRTRRHKKRGLSQET